MILLPALYRSLTVDQLLVMAGMPLRNGEALTDIRLRRAVLALAAFEREHGCIPEIPPIEPEPQGTAEWLAQQTQRLTDRVAPEDLAPEEDTCDR